MKKIKKLSWIRNLMVLSQVLLIVFIGQWVYSQYQEEKKALIKEINQQLLASKQEVLDSMIVFRIINPILKDSKGFKIHMEVDDDTAKNRKTFIADKIEVKNLRFKHPDSLIFRDSLPMHFEKKITISNKRDIKNKLLMQGVKLIYKEVNSISGDSSQNTETQFYSTDSLLLKKLFAQKLDKSGLNLKYAWINENRENKITTNPSTILIKSDILPDVYGLEVSKYNPYLLKKISPQLFFGFILLLLTGLSFVLAYSSLRNQIRLSVLRNDFISNISHELKTPVSTVKVAIEALQDFDRKKDPKVVSDYLQMAGIEMNRLDTLIDKVMNTSIMEDGKLLIQPEKVDLKVLIDNTVNDLKIRFAHLNATVKFSSLHETAFTILDPVHIKGVLVNLIDNSLKYSNTKPEIIIDLEKTNKEWIVNIADNGPGILPEYRDKIFDKFFRVPSENKHNVKGYGLGLSYAKLIMEQHKGSITYKNRPEGGSIFTLYIPDEFI